MINRKLLYCFLLVGILLLFGYQGIFQMDKHSLASPWSDQYYHVAMAEHIKINHNTSYGPASPYQYSLLYSSMLISLDLITGWGMIGSAEFLNLFVPVILGLIIYCLAIKIFNNKLIAIFSMIIIMITAISNFFMFDPRRLSDIFFLLIFGYILILFSKEGKALFRQYMAFSLLLFLMLLSHPGGFVRHGIVVVILLLVLRLRVIHIFFEEEPKFNVKEKGSKLLLLFFIISIGGLIVALTDYSHTLPSLRGYFLLSPFSKSGFYNALEVVGPFTLVFSLVGLLFLGFKREYLKREVTLLLSWTFITIFISFMPIGTYFYREGWMIIFPFSLIAGYGLYQAILKLPKLYEVKRNYIIGGTLFLLIFLSIVGISLLKTEDNRPFANTVVWAKNNLDNGKVIGYHRMMWGCQILFVKEGLEPGLPFSRNISLLESNPIYIEIMQENANPAIAMERENIRYVITTVWENYQRFMSENFKLIYEVEWPGVENRCLRIFELLRMGGM